MTMFGTTSLVKNDLVKQSKKNNHEIVDRPQTNFLAYLNSYDKFQCCILITLTQVV